eukprot:14082051-Alexandrium_andersonii.AAC.1
MSASLVGSEMCIRDSSSSASVGGLVSLFQKAAEAGPTAKTALRAPMRRGSAATLLACAVVVASFS